MSAYRDQLAAAVRAVTIRGPGAYSWLGRAGPRLIASVESSVSPAERRRHFVAALGHDLYECFYCHGRPTPVRIGGAAPLTADAALIRALSDANSGRGGWDESGWIVERVDDTEAVVSTPRLRVRVAVGDCDAGDIRPGAEVRLRLPKDLPALSPGFHTVVSDSPGPPPAGVRLYWHVGADEAPALVRCLTSTLNGSGVPFRLKIANHPLRFDRCDAAILYLSLDAYTRVRAALQRVSASLVMRPRTPALTLALGRGLGAAEDDGTGESFGVRRCAQIAEGIMRAYERRLARPAARIEAVAAHLAECGVDPDTPYLEPAFVGRHVL